MYRIEGRYLRTIPYVGRYVPTELAGWRVRGGCDRKEGEPRGNVPPQPSSLAKNFRRGWVPIRVENIFDEVETTTSEEDGQLISTARSKFVGVGVHRVERPNPRAS